MLFCLAIYIFWNQRVHFPLIPGAICVVLWVDLQHCNCGLSQRWSSLFTTSTHFLFNCAIFGLQNNLISVDLTASATSPNCPMRRIYVFDSEWILIFTSEAKRTIASYARNHSKIVFELRFLLHLFAPWPRNAPTIPSIYRCHFS